MGWSTFQDTLYCIEIKSLILYESARSHLKKSFGAIAAVLALGHFLNFQLRICMSYYMYTVFQEYEVKKESMLHVFALLQNNPPVFKL